MAGNMVGKSQLVFIPDILNARRDVGEVLEPILLPLLQDFPEVILQ